MSDSRLSSGQGDGGRVRPLSEKVQTRAHSLFGREKHPGSQAQTHSTDK